MSDWQDDALCQGKHQDLWFPPFADERTESEAKYYDIAKMVCEHCPVREQCLEAGEDEVFGVWGGADPADRKNGGEPEPSQYVLIPRYLDLIPNHTPGIPVDVVALKALLKRYADKRQ